MYDKNCGEKMFGKRIYLALRENLADQAAFKDNGRVKSFSWRALKNYPIFRSHFADKNFLRIKNRIRFVFPLHFLEDFCSLS